MRWWIYDTPKRYFPLLFTRRLETDIVQNSFYDVRAFFIRARSTGLRNTILCPVPNVSHLWHYGLTSHTYCWCFKWDSSVRTHKVHEYGHGWTQHYPSVTSPWWVAINLKPIVCFQMNFTSSPVCNTTYYKNQQIQLCVNISRARLTSLRGQWTVLIDKNHVTRKWCTWVKKPSEGHLTHWRLGGGLPINRTQQVPFSDEALGCALLMLPNKKWCWFKAKMD